MDVSAPERRWFAGYTVAIVSTIALVATAPGQTMLLSLLNLPLRQAFGLDALTLNASYTVATVVAALPLVWVGRLTDRFGPRRTMIAVALLFGAACSFMATAQNLAMVLLGFFSLRLLGQGSLALVSNHALAMWFHHRLGSVRGLITVATFLAWAPLPGLTQWSIDAFGWRVTWAALGATVAIGVALVAARFLHDRPEDLGLTVDGASAPAVDSEARFDLSQALRTGAFWRLTSASVVSAMVGTAVLFDLQPLLRARGLDASDAAWAVGAWGIAMATLALPTGRLIDRVAPRLPLAVGSFSMAGSCGLLWGTRSGVMALVALAGFALGQSLIMAAVGATTARYFGRAHHGAIRSAVSRISVVATGVGPLVFGFSQSRFGDHDAALIAFAAVSLFVALGALFLRRPPAAPAAPTP